MSWTVQIGNGHPLEVSSPEAVAAAVAGILMGSGLDARMARTYGQNARDAILLNEDRRRVDWSTKPLDWVQVRPQGEPVHIQATWLSEQPGVQCSGYTSSGNRCGRSMNHRGGC